MQHLADDQSLFLAHSAVQNLSLSIEDLNLMLQKMFPNYPNVWPQMVLNMYDPEHEDTPTPIIRVVKKPFNILYCVPPKFRVQPSCGVTLWTSVYFYNSF